MAVTYEPISTYTVSGSTTSTFTFSSIPATYTDLRLVFNGAVGTATLTVAARYNADTATNYSLTRLSGNGTAAASSRNASLNYIPITDDVSPGGSTTIPTFGSLDIFSYTSAIYKSALGTVSNDQNGTGNMERIVSMWRSTSTITSITVFITSGTSYYFANGATATLYGILKA